MTDEPTRNAHLEALEAIESLVSAEQAFDWDWLAANKKLRGRAKEMQAVIAQVYRFAHAANETHECYHVHEDWRAELRRANG